MKRTIDQVENTDTPLPKIEKSGELQTDSNNPQKPFDHLENYLTEPSWLELLADEFKKPYFLKLKQELNSDLKFVKQKEIFPAITEIFTAFNLCPVDKIKCVIVGQDPYHTPGCAHGLAFSVKPGIATPPSLVNIFKELSTDIEGFKTPKNGNLSGWAKQGVFLINTALTVRKGQANSHKDYGWQQFVDRVIQLLAEKRERLVFLLWGNQAKAKSDLIKNKSIHRIFSSGHPSPLSAHKGFFGYKHFSLCNDYLTRYNIPKIDWQKTDSFEEEIKIDETKIVETKIDETAVEQETQIVETGAEQ